MKTQDTQRTAERKARIDERLGGTQELRFHPMNEGSNVRYEVSDRVTATQAGGIALIHEMVRYLGLPEAIDSNLHLFKRTEPEQFLPISDSARADRKETAEREMLSTGRSR